jgi:UDP-glucose 4-epimerase
MTILVTGGAGYIGSHTVVELVTAGHNVVIADNFDNSSPVAVDRLRKLTGANIALYTGDVADRQLLASIFAEHKIDAVINFAGYKAVGESAALPLKYYRNNVGLAIALCEEMAKAGVKKLIFSSSATVYGASAKQQCVESDQTGAGIVNPYGRTKYMIEEILKDVCAADPEWAVTSLRYFNPIGAHPSGQIGEDPADIPNNLMPYVAQVAVGKLDRLNVFGDDYDTPDGTGQRDYIDVVDLARGHVAALEHMSAGPDMKVYNLGTGKPVSVLELVHAFEAASGCQIPYKVIGRRAGDLACYYADPSKAERELGWHATRTLSESCANVWRWQSTNPAGYKTSAAARN